MSRYHGYRDLALEIPFSIGPIISSYINNEVSRTYIDSILQSAKTIYSAEFFQFLDSLKTFNATSEKKSKIRVWGFDLDQYYDYALLQLKNSIQKLGNQYAKRFTEITIPIPVNYKKNTSIRSQYTSDPIRVAIDELRSFTDSLITKLDKDDQFVVAMCVQQLERSFEYFSEANGSFAFRDKNMAENAIAISEQIQSTRLMLWGHNLHIKKNSVGFKNMGDWLNEKYGKIYFPIGSIFKEGSYRVWYKGVLSQKSLPASTSGDLALFLDEIAYPAFWFLAGDIKPFFKKERVDIHDVGIVQLVDKPKANKAVLFPFRNFEAYFYFDTITALPVY
ncbi:MAG TPA: erythromycin esterase family protein [Chitinophagaceae bacterium]|nr:erythromycin esterase family protein [Chitinophagaceae bacterium]